MSARGRPPLALKNDPGRFALALQIALTRSFRIAPYRAAAIAAAALTASGKLFCDWMDDHHLRASTILPVTAAARVDGLRRKTEAAITRTSNDELAWLIDSVAGLRTLAASEARDDVTGVLRSARELQDLGWAEAIGTLTERLRDAEHFSVPPEDDPRLVSVLMPRPIFFGWRYLLNSISLAGHDLGPACDPQKEQLIRRRARRRARKRSERAR